VGSMGGVGGGGIKGREEVLRGRNSRIASSLEIVPRERLLLGLVGVGEGEGRGPR